jgi:hypothetical protein
VSAHPNTVRFLVWMLLGPAVCSSQTGPVAPCGQGPLPLYAELGDSAIVKSWSRAEFGRTWVPPTCIGWAEAGFTTLVTTGARFRYTSSEALLRHIGAISQLAGMRYWSTSRRQWQVLVVGAHALKEAPWGAPRGDFTPEELTKGQTVNFEQEDNLAGKVIYRMHVMEASPEHFVFEVENVGTVRRFLLPIFHPGDLQTIYFLDRESADIWRFYSMVRTGTMANGLVAGSEASSINRAIAFYRHMVGIPTAQEPPAAR